MIVVERVAVRYIYQAYRLVDAGTINESAQQRPRPIVLRDDLIPIVGVVDRHIGRAVDRPRDALIRDGLRRFAEYVLKTVRRVAGQHKSRPYAPSRLRLKAKGSLP